MKISKEDLKDIVRIYSEGKMNQKQIGKFYGVSGAAVRQRLIKIGINVKADQSILQRKYRLNEDFFNEIDSESKAYFLGWLFSDGYNYQSRNIICLEIESGDSYILDKFSSLIESERPIFNRAKRRANGKEMRIMNLTSRKLCQQLALLGCTQRKSLTLQFPSLDILGDNLRHFIRGYFDGDGSIYLPKKKRTYQGCIVDFTCTPMFATVLSEVIKNKLNLDMKIYKNKNRNPLTCCCRIAGSATIDLLNWIYKDSSIFLTRKYKKYKEFDRLVNC